MHIRKHAELNEDGRSFGWFIATPDGEQASEFFETEEEAKEATDKRGHLLDFGFSIKHKDEERPNEGWGIRTTKQYDDEFDEISESNPSAVRFLARALPDIKERKGMFPSSRYVKFEEQVGDSKIYCLRETEGSGGQFRAYFVVDGEGFLFVKALLKKRNKADSVDFKTIVNRLR